MCGSNLASPQRCCCQNHDFGISSRDSPHLAKPRRLFFFWRTNEAIIAFDIRLFSDAADRGSVKCLLCQGVAKGELHANWPERNYTCNPCVTKLAGRCFRVSQTQWRLSRPCRQFKAIERVKSREEDRTIAPQVSSQGSIGAEIPTPESFERQLLIYDLVMSTTFLPGNICWEFEEERP
jgi:hypothetical protein